MICFNISSITTERSVHLNLSYAKSCIEKHGRLNEVLFRFSGGTVLGQFARQLASRGFDCRVQVIGELWIFKAIIDSVFLVIFKSIFSSRPVVCYRFLMNFSLVMSKMLNKLNILVYNSFIHPDPNPNPISNKRLTEVLYPQS